MMREPSKLDKFLAALDRSITVEDTIVSILAVVIFIAIAVFY